MMKRVLTLLGMVLSLAGVHAQDDIDSLMNGSIDDFRKGAKARHEQFRRYTRRDYEQFRRRAMEEYTAFLRNPWKELKAEKPVPLPEEKPVPPVVVPKDEPPKPIESHPIKIGEVLKPVPVAPQPQPVTPIFEQPVVEVKTVAFTFFGTQASVRFDVANTVRVAKADEQGVANAMSRFKREAFDNMLYDCLKLRERLHLSDWAYLGMLHELADKIAGEKTNESTLLLGWLYMQSGYKMRLAYDGHRLYMLYATPHYIYGGQSYKMDGDYYYGVEPLPTRLHFSQAAFPKEKNLSLQITQPQQFDNNETELRTIVSKRFPDVKISVAVNKNLIRFYETYPTSMLNDNFMTRWAFYANTPMDERVARQLYPALREKLKGLSQTEAVNRLLNLVQTGFVYGYDSEIWGHDRAFFAEESLYYPYCDCEDRSILLTRLVRDLLGLRCILVYYPGHLASAVCFTEGGVAGDYIELDGRRFVIADGTITGWGAPVGRTMTGMDNSKATVILLE